MSLDEYQFRAPESQEDWAAYHAIRRRAFFEVRRAFDFYDENYPDEKALNNYPRLLIFEGEPIGTIRIDIRGEQATFRLVAIAERHQGCGHGHVVLEHAKAFAISKGCTEIISHVADVAVGFYAKFGFSELGIPDDPGHVAMGMKAR